MSSEILPLEKIHDEIKNNLSIYVDAARERNIESMMSIFEKDSLLLMNGQKILGRENIGSTLKTLFDNINPLDFDITSVNAYQVGQDIYETGTNSIVTEVDGKRVETPGTYTTVWRKQSDDSWKVIVDLIVP
jgi:uncharacterized protein (TIGR02246 family)